MNDETPKNESADKRKQRRQQVAAANKITFILDTKVRRFVMGQAKEAGMDIAPFLQKIVENHVMTSAPEGDPLAERLKAKRAVLDQAVALAGKAGAEGGFDEYFILNVMKKVPQDAELKSRYGQAVGAGNENPSAATGCH